MNIVITLSADSVEELRIAACKALDLQIPASVGIVVPPEREQGDLANKRPVGRPRKEINRNIGPMVTGVVAVEEPGPAPEEDFVVDMDEPNGADHDPIALEKLKQETVAKLPDMFAAGKVNLMRAVLTKYGKGAKSFPEIEAKDFPEIAAALARGDGS